MISKKLQRARDFEKKYIPYVAEELPKFHVTGGIGWINDPNGFAPYHGEYHLFYQYHPYDVKWGPGLRQVGAASRRHSPGHGL